MRRKASGLSRTAGWTLLAIVAIAFALRVRNIATGLPDFLDEAIPFRHALEMWDPIAGAVDWNPHIFHYPSLSFTLHLLLMLAQFSVGRIVGAYDRPADFHLQCQLDPTTMVIAARLLCLAFDLWTVVSVARIGERLRPGAGLIAALVVACAATMIRTSHGIHVDTYMTAFAAASLDRMLRWRASGRPLDLTLAVVWIGLAAGSKYPGALMLVPLAIVLVGREGLRGAWTWVLCAATAAVVFLVTTPFAVLDPIEFRRGFSFVRDMAASGHLGALDTPGFLYYLRSLAADFGWSGLMLLAASLVLLLAMRPLRVERLVLWAAVLCFGVPVSIAHVEAERYLVPLIPAAALLAAEAALALATRTPAPARRWVAAAAALVLIGPAAVPGVRAATTEEDWTRFEARRWCEQHLDDRALVVQELYGPPVLGRLTWQTLRVTPMVRAARPALQREFDRRRWLRSVEIPIVVVGDNWLEVRPPGRRLTKARFVEHAVDLNQAYYDPRMLRGVDIMITSSAVRGRFEADTGRFVLQHRFYALLDSTAEIAARIAPQGNRIGPEITIYRLTPRTRERIEALGPLDAVWWARLLPERDRASFAALWPRDDAAGASWITPDGRPARWLAELERVFDVRYGPFVRALALEQLDLGNWEDARRLAVPILLMIPDDVGACLIYTDASASLGDWASARAVLEHTIAARAPRGDVPGILRLQHAAVLERLGERENARAEYARLAAGPDPETAATAAAKLRGFETPR